MKDKIEKLEQQVEYVKYTIEELTKCMNDPIYFINNYVKFLHPRRGPVPFVLTEAQIKLLTHYHNNQYNLATTTRQMGQTTITAAYFLWLGIFSGSYKKHLFAGNKMANAKEFLDIVRGIYEGLPVWLKPALLKNNKTTIEFDNGASLIAGKISRNFGRGMTISTLLVDNIAYANEDDADGFIRGIYPCLSNMQTKTIIHSTPSPSKSDDVFSRLYQELPHNKFSFIRITSADSGKDEIFKQFTVAIIGQHRWDTEYDCKFIWEQV